MREVLIREILKEICEDIINEKEKIIADSNIGVHTGTSGISLFLFYMHRLTSNPSYHENACYFLEKTFEKINSNNCIPSICTGLSGACWVVNHLIENYFIGEENDEVLNDLDEYLFDSMKKYISIDYFDFFHGSAGIAFYFQKRIIKCKNSKAYLKYFTDSIQKSVEYDYNNKIYKLQLFDGVRKKYDVGMAHGLSSIVIILSRILSNDLNNHKLRETIEGIINYFDSIEIVTENIHELMYPAIGKSNEYLQTKCDKIGWCYGDLGVGLAYLNTAKALHNQKYKDKSNVIFKRSSLNQNLISQNIRDPCMCHGSSGIANMFRFLSERLNEEEIKKAEEFWIDVTLDFYRNSRLKGFSMFKNDEYQYCYNILEGTAGIGLTLLSYLKRIDRLNWDEIFLLS